MENNCGENIPSFEIIEKKVNIEKPSINLIIFF